MSEGLTVRKGGHVSILNTFLLVHLLVIQPPAVSQLLDKMRQIFEGFIIEVGTGDRGANGGVYR